MAARMDTLDPAFRPIVERVATRIAAENLPMVLAETDRDYAKQADCFKRGVSKCDGLRNISLHQARLAADFVALDEKGNRSWDYAKYKIQYKRMAEIAREEGAEVGQDWAPFDKATGFGWDPPHIQYKAKG